MASTGTRTARTVSSEVPEPRAGQIRAVLEGLDFGTREQRLTEAQLEQAVLSIAADPGLFEDLVVDSPDRRWWVVLYRADNYEVRLLSWEFDQSSGWHDHGGSAGGYVVTTGVLVERYRGDDGVAIETSRHEPGDHGNFGATHVHDVLHEEGRPAVSIHAYSPPLTLLTRYESTPLGFVVTGVTPDDSRGAPGPAPGS